MRRVFKTTEISALVAGIAPVDVSVETARAEAAEVLLIPLAQKAAASGVASLDSGSHLTAGQVPPSTVNASSTGGVPAWAASGTVYGLNHLVTNGGNTYICTTAHTSGSTFAGELGDWQAVGTVVSAGDTSIVVGGTSSAPTIETATLNVIASDHPPAADWSNNSHKITALANGSGAQDAAAFGQIPTAPIAPIVGTVTQSATPSINTGAMNVASITALAQAITSMTTNLTGTPVDGQTLIVRITDNGTGRAITWGAKFEASTVALPTTTVTSTLLCVGFLWNTVTSAWRCVAVA